MSAAFASSLSPAPASISMVLPPPRTSHARIASRMRLRASGGATFSQSGFGHDAEHGAAVEAEVAVDDRRQRERSERDRPRRHGQREPPGAALLELERTPLCRRRMNERDTRAMRAGPWRLVHEANAARLQPVERGLQVVDGQRDVMDARSAPLDRTARSPNPAPSPRAAPATPGPQARRRRGPAPWARRAARRPPARAHRDRTQSRRTGRRRQCRCDRGVAFMARCAATAAPALWTAASRDRAPARPRDTGRASSVIRPASASSSASGTTAGRAA